MIKKILLSFLFSPLLLLASPQNLANISDLKESIAILIDRLNTLEKQMNDLKQKDFDVLNQTEDFNKEVQSSDIAKDEEDKNKTNTKKPENALNVKESENKDIQELKNKIEALESQIKNQSSNKETPDNKQIGVLEDRLSHLEDFIKKLKDSSPLSQNKAEDSNNQSEVSDSKIKESQGDIATKEQFKAFSDYVNQKLSDFESKITAQPHSQTLYPKESSQSNQCDHDCISKADFSNYKFERIQKEKNLQRQINILKKQLDDLNIQIREIKNYYEGS